MEQKLLCTGLPPIVRDVYKELTYQQLKDIIEDAMFSKDPELSTKAYAITPEGLIPIEESKAFHKAMQAELKRMNR